MSSLASGPPCKENFVASPGILVPGAGHLMDRQPASKMSETCGLSGLCSSVPVHRKRRCHTKDFLVLGAGHKKELAASQQDERSLWGPWSLRHCAQKTSSPHQGPLTDRAPDRQSLSQTEPHTHRAPHKPRTQSPSHTEPFTDRAPHRQSRVRELLRYGGQTVVVWLFRGFPKKCIGHETAPPEGKQLHPILPWCTLVLPWSATVCPSLPWSALVCPGLSWSALGRGLLWSALATLGNGKCNRNPTS